MTATTATPLAVEADVVPFTLLNTGRAVRRSRFWLLDQWQRAIIPRLDKCSVLNPEQADFIFDDVMKQHEAARELLGGDARVWDLPKEAVEAATQNIFSSAVTGENLPTPKYLILLLEHLKAGNPTPALDPILQELRDEYGPNPPDEPGSLKSIPACIRDNKLGRASLASYIENNPATITIPTTAEEMIRSVYIALLYRFLTETLGNLHKGCKDLLALYNKHPALKLRLTTEPHAFLALGHTRGVDHEACYGAGGFNSRYAVLLAAQPNSVVCQIGYPEEGTKRFTPCFRSWGRIHEDGIMLSNFYPKMAKGYTLGQALLLAACFPKGNLPSPYAVHKAFRVHSEQSNKTPQDPCLWRFKGYDTAPLYHNGDAFWYPLDPKTGKIPEITGRVPKAYAEVSWAHPFSFPSYTE